ncbi:MAG TPA: hypothetical protein VK508_16520 [Cyclobacteriaceae bacterium]|nr:hypothetical protein [Cyclobacteriaceae bacterium]
MVGQLIRFGNLSLLYEEGFIRYIKYGNFEILRMVYFALRDSNWTTATLVRSDEKVSVTPDGFDISYVATNKAGGKDVLRWNVAITGNKQGDIEFSVEGKVLGMYNRNRAGICVLHPIRETMNKTVKVTRPDGSVYESKFPQTINPHQPFLDITRMNWQLEGYAWAVLEFEGDTFETEDQRNWSDTSFKTYSTPLTTPYPVMLKPGDLINQKVKLKLVGIEGLPTATTKFIEVTIDESRRTVFPSIGAEFPGMDLSSHKDVGLLTDLGFEHIRIEVNFGSDSWKDRLRAGLTEAQSISANPFVFLVFGNEAIKDWDQFVKQLDSNQVKRITKLAVSPIDRKANVDELLATILPKARSVFPHAAIGAGFRSYFTDLNRNRFDCSGIDFVTYPVTPTAHAKDSLTMIENLPAQEDAVRSAAMFAKGKKIYVGPVSLRPPFNPDATSEVQKVDDVLPSRYDVRQETALAAGWAMASIKYVAEGGAESITLFESHGMAGYFLGDDDWKHKDFLTAVKIFPVYDALITLRKLKPAKVIRSVSSQPVICSSMVVEGDGGRFLVLVNHTDVGISVKVGDKMYPVSGWETSISALTT